MKKVEQHPNIGDRVLSFYLLLEFYLPVLAPSVF